MLARTAGCLAARIGEGTAAFAHEICAVGRIGLQINRAADDKPEHHAVTIQPGAREHAPHRDRAELREQIADEFNIQGRSRAHLKAKWL